MLHKWKSMLHKQISRCYTNESRNVMFNAFKSLLLLPLSDVMLVFLCVRFCAPLFPRFNVFTQSRDMYAFAPRHLCGLSVRATFAADKHTIIRLNQPDEMAWPRKFVMFFNIINYALAVTTFICVTSTYFSYNMCKSVHTVAKI
jgi:hypothetical protein